MVVWRELRSPPTGLLLVTLSLCLVRARDQPSLDITLGNTVASLVPGDALLLALAVVAVAALLRQGLERDTWLPLGAGAGFCALLLATAAANGTTALVAGTRLVELAALGLGAAVLIRTRRQVEAVVDVVLLFTIVADAIGLVKFVTGGGGRQASFLGEHDFAALATLPLVYGLALVLGRDRYLRAGVAIVAGGIGCVLGAALASLIGLYLGAAALLVLVALRRRLDWRGLVVTAAVVGAVTAGTLTIRAGELGFLQSWFGKPPSRPGQYAASWSQRLIYAYIGGRVFLAHPIAGTGWYGLLPPEQFDRYLPAARRRFADQPANYFPPPDRPFIPQQTYDQVLYELGVLGGSLLLLLLAGLVRAAVRAERRAHEAARMLPAAWLGAAVGALAGEGLFGGTPLAALFWLVAGLALALSRAGVVA
jgi:hypothetical protein